MQSDIHAEEDSFAGDELRPVEVISLLYFLHLNTNDIDGGVKSVRELSRCVSVIWSTATRKKLVGKYQKIHIVGSFSEGSFSDSYESDYDILYSPNDTLCFDSDLQSFENACCEYGVDQNPKHGIKNMFIAERTNASPGYIVMIKIEKYLECHNRLGEEVKDALADNSHYFYDEATAPPDISVSGPALHINATERTNDFLKPYLTDFMTRILKIMPCAEADLVLAIPYYSKQLERAWMQRKRMRGWPSPKLIQAISELHGHVVPVGMKGSRLEKYEWRISYTLLENKLVHSFSQVQMSLYLELKKYAKRSGCLTSYMMKNIVFWMAECLPSHYFQDKYFIPLVRSTLVVLRKCVERKYLPNYMISSRNLFAGKLDDEMERHKLIDFLSSSRKDCIDLDTFQKLQRLLHTFRSRNTNELSSDGENIRTAVVIRQYALLLLEVVFKGNQPSYMKALRKTLRLFMYITGLESVFERNSSFRS